MSVLRVVGLGPGDEAFLTPQARAALEASDVIVGYTVYVELVRAILPDKRFFSTPMRGEVERCREALDLAAGGQSVAVVCSGDAGVYGMAGLVLQLAVDAPATEVEVEVVPGVTAALAGAAVLGAPLMHDFAVVSLSDLLTPWELIERRLEAAAQADFSLCLYNPASRKRADYLARACDVLLRAKDPATACGWVRMIGRPGQEAGTCDLAALRDRQVDMFTTVFVGNSQTRLAGGRMITPRGYRIEAAR
ncbi:precorrin-3B C(17)-methyltransferase [Eggerthellaceae bacterium zg-1084]|uniref:Precorrin-3B C(17)-methyltransferase n=1 Tax=Berryella wangjianweii TaxID=2734634 RepID=A0A6M8J2G2_9ACTN|nr:precorrin-3B C(17)-methyltransferase [Berryella wangjianweii]NPD31333.1 precorrin-3B C(17)-methyltransferase [Berryella wangjianweii]NPD32358.1 precorrin-3B C(17)-methyltransferase [Eggerthellaceae bacterium zg-997]QKF06873.1 precorrin-3B C(17)-methyltransferase [Berryella wangjianweii]